MRSSLCLIFFGWMCAPSLQAQGVNVSAKILVHPQQPAEAMSHQRIANPANVVVWLVPLEPVDPKPANPPRQTPYRLVQKNKQFTPHLLVVPTGTSVEFPNRDPFFHNVFSLFNGKSFDLGLYESGTSRSVRFDREGASYIFCNIHPEMGAVVLALSTPYYGISTADGAVLIRNVPVGSYQVHIWGENVQPAGIPGSQRMVQVSTSDVNLGEVTLQQTSDLMKHHKNKFGEEYPLTNPPRY